MASHNDAMPVGVYALDEVLRLGRQEISSMLRMYWLKGQGAGIGHVVVPEPVCAAYRELYARNPLVAGSPEVPLALEDLFFVKDYSVKPTNTKLLTGLDVKASPNEWSVVDDAITAYKEGMRPYVVTNNPQIVTLVEQVNQRHKFGIEILTDSFVEQKFGVLPLLVDTLTANNLTLLMPDAIVSQLYALGKNGTEGSCIRFLKEHPYKFGNAEIVAETAEGIHQPLALRLRGIETECYNYAPVIVVENTRQVGQYLASHRIIPKNGDLFAILSQERRFLPSFLGIFGVPDMLNMWQVNWARV